MGKYVFVYNGAGANPESADDLKELFTCADIYADPNVILTDFNRNFDGLDPRNVTVILPGGSTVLMGQTLLPNKIKIQDLVARGSNYVGICAGAYLATHHADIFRDSYTQKNIPGVFDIPTYRTNTRAYFSEPPVDLNLNLVYDYKALGAFIPNDTYLHSDKPLHASIRKPYCVDLLLEEEQLPTKQMYLSGCGFEPSEEITANPNPPCEVVATYRRTNPYSFFYPKTNETKSITNMPAIIRRPGVLLSGAHLETCVPNSKLLQLFEEGADTLLPLPESEFETYDPAASRDFVIPLLKTTLNSR